MPQSFSDPELCFHDCRMTGMGKAEIFRKMPQVVMHIVLLLRSGFLHILLQYKLTILHSSNRKRPLQPWWLGAWNFGSVSVRLIATRLSRERKEHRWAQHKHCCQFSSVLDAGRDFLCGVRISSYEATGELGFNLQGGRSTAEGRGEESGGNTVFWTHMRPGIKPRSCPG